MTQQDRTEIREMIHGILSGWQAATIAREDMTNNSLTQINDHLKKINGQVAESVKDISELKLKEATHIIDCPAMPKIEVIQKDLEEYRFVKKYPKLVIILVAFFVIGIIISTIGTFKSLNNNILMKKVQKESEITNEILLPAAIKRGINIDSIRLNVK